jgi:NADPH-dependent glutamate synthase beta subunit-like oxidoreductase
MTETALTYHRFKEGEHEWDDWQEKIFKADTSYKCPTYVHRTAPCQASCPSGHDIRGWLAIARGQDKPTDPDMPWQEYAFQRMVEANPFPAVMGRVCPAPCEDGCNRNEVDDYVGINGVEHYVGDWAIEHGLKLPEPGADTGKKVAVIGGGPAGLTAAYQLRRRGHAVAIFDEHEELGGMMRYGIPGFRTPREVLDAEIQRILDTGVETRLQTRVGTDISMEDLEKEFDAVFWALGAQSGRDLPVPGWKDAPNCISGVAFLRAFNEGRLRHVTGKVIVVGGGDTSVDVATVARRLGHISTTHKKDHHVEDVVFGHTAHDVADISARQGCDVTLTSLMPREEMFASDREVEDALHEGVELVTSVMPLEVIVGDEGRAVGLKMCECDMDGNKPVPREGTEFTLEGELIVAAIGQSGALEGLEPLDNGRGFIDADKHFQVKDMPHHFAGGDILRPHLLTTAIGHGRIAADTIEQHFDNPELPKRPKVDVHHFNLVAELRRHEMEPEEFPHKPLRGTDHAHYAVHNYEDRSTKEVIPHDSLFKGHFGYHARNFREERKVGPDEVIGNFEERIVRFSEEQAIDEGKRCMSCGLCFECDNCVIFCPQTAVFRVKKSERATGRYVDTDYGKCIGCHICSDVCPTGYIQMGLGE